MRVSDLLKLVGKLFLVFVAFGLILVGLGSGMGEVELGIWAVLLIAALYLTCVQHIRRVRS
ncbi:hypothetical protein Pth03_27360 [Planotetraspora thailandica]|uniref:Uncharacterized protein n=1 Tax=Planotetraspora thailandica TaxID=487172 RepID=A0A8J3UZB2_9ACTN|nr:hypothetical protein Pth03_27360 [Planotetraspora thailandica]